MFLFLVQENDTILGEPQVLTWRPDCDLPCHCLRTEKAKKPSLSIGAPVHLLLSEDAVKNTHSLRRPCFGFAIVIYSKETF